MTNRFTFRAWDKQNNKIIPWEGMLGWAIEALQNSNIMQCTGLKDKNNKLIYEGDILKREETEIIEIVEWKENMWTEEGFMTGFGEWFSHPDCYQIIGNIYENPDLLIVPHAS